MRRRQALAIAATLALAAGLTVGVREHGSSAQAAPPAQRPNVLVLETDDQTLAEMQVLPNVKRLIGDQGVTFDNNFDSFSLCCSRAMTRRSSKSSASSPAPLCSPLSASSTTAACSITR